MAKQTTTKPRLSRTHRHTARLLDSAYRAGRTCAPRNVRTSLTRRLGCLAEDAGIDRTGLTAEETYLAAVRALDGRETARTKEIRAIVDEWLENEIAARQSEVARWKES